MSWTCAQKAEDEPTGWSDAGLGIQSERPRAAAMVWNSFLRAATPCALERWFQGLRV